MQKSQQDFHIVIENELNLIINKEKTLLRLIKTQTQKIKITPQNIEFDKDILLTFPHIGVIFFISFSSIKSFILGV